MWPYAAIATVMKVKLPHKEDLLASNRIRITTDIFSIPYKDNFIVYAPLKKAAFLANRDAVDCISAIIKGSNTGLEKRNQKTLITMLTASGIINGEPGFPPAYEKKKVFKPLHGTIFPTSDCNLRCVYCYANAGEEKRYMQWETAKAAIDFVAGNAVELKCREFTVGFHGGGEPMSAAPMIQRCVAYSKEFASRNNLSVKFTGASNGVLSGEQIQWIASNLQWINISFDGPRDIQNAQRPLADGTGSFESVFKTVKKFEELNVAYGLRATITDMSVGRMPELVDFFCSNFKVKSLHFEPLHGCGRCASSGWQQPDAYAFTEGFLKAKQQAKKYGVRMYYSGASIISLRTSFCGAAGSNFCVTPDGHVTACYEVPSIHDAKASLFVYGEYDKKTRQFNIDIDKINALGSTTVNNMPHCKDCFGKWHCAGDCFVKALLPESPGTRGVSYRCKINRELMQQELVDYLEKKDLQTGSIDNNAVS